MNKKELLKLKSMRATAGMKKVLLNDQGEEAVQYGSTYGTRKTSKHIKYKYYKYMLAEVENGILKVAIWTRKRLYMDWKQVPDFMIYIDKSKGDWLTFEYHGTRWLEAMICNLLYIEQSGEGWGSLFYSSKSTDKVVADYLGGNKIAYSAVKDYQQEIRKDILNKKHRSELEQIDEFMAAVPEYPKGFNNSWLIKNAYVDKTTIFYKPGKNVTEGWCTHCEKMVPIKVKPKHLMTGKCQKCRNEVTFRSWGRQRVLQETKDVGILQKTRNENEYCLSVFSTRVEWRQDKEYRNPTIWQADVYRFRMDQYFRIREEFEWYEYKNSGVIRWCHATRHMTGYYYRYASPYCVLYQNNLKQLRKDTLLKYVPIEDFLNHYKGKQMEADDVLCKAAQYPEVEVMIKTGMYSLVKEIVTSYGVPDVIRTGMKKLEDTLKLDKVRMRQAVRMDININELKILQVSYREKVQLEDDQIRMMAKYLIHKDEFEIGEFLRRGNITKTLTYLEKLWKERDVSPSYIYSDYKDFIQQLITLGIPVTKENRFPANFYALHTEYARRIAEIQNAKDKRETKRKDKLLKKMLVELQELYEVEHKSLMIVWPQCKADFVAEGQVQHNCVGTNGYYERMIEGKIVVFFLRKKEDPLKPFCTVEFQNGRMIQCRIVYNGAAPDEAQKFCELVSKTYKKRLEERAKEKAIC